ncbi:MAG TPA: signal peptidase II [Aquabacterium sp.]|uniref:signal peptidase II n=1 Tax=Aquabacterium sp. TaxID=1872578 RepID=UPI002DA822FD|nr:signal peptidase II [Aquabacterium sp.]HET6789441.1 signal peptidase II [Aquabacterium sp.]HEX5373317.1 signal peptidase II [Aquabacterium sp.]
MATRKAGGGGLLPWLGIALIIVLLDQITKIVVLGAFDLGDSRPVTSFFNLVRVHNTGAAFSFLAQAGGWQRWFFVGLGAAAVSFILYMLRQHGHQRMFSWALTLIMGGAIGNVIDRMVHGYVVDFLDFHWAILSPLFYRGHFPAFNIADCAISIGAALLILDEIVRVRRS